MNDRARRLLTSREHDARQADRKEAARGSAASVCRERVEIRELRLAEDLHARGHDAVEVTSEREAALLDARVTDRPVQAGFTGEPLERDTQTNVGDELTHGDVTEGRRRRAAGWC